MVAEDPVTILFAVTSIAIALCAAYIGLPRYRYRGRARDLQRIRTPIIEEILTPLAHDFVLTLNCFVDLQKKVEDETASDAVGALETQFQDYNQKVGLPDELLSVLKETYQEVHLSDVITRIQPTSENPEPWGDSFLPSLNLLKSSSVPEPEENSSGWRRPRPMTLDDLKRQTGITKEMLRAPFVQWLSGQVIDSLGSEQDVPESLRPVRAKAATHKEKTDSRSRSHLRRAFRQCVVPFYRFHLDTSVIVFLLLGNIAIPISLAYSNFISVVPKLNYAWILTILISCAIAFFSKSRRVGCGLLAIAFWFILIEIGRLWGADYSIWGANPNHRASLFPVARYGVGAGIVLILTIWGLKWHEAKDVRPRRALSLYKADTNGDGYDSWAARFIHAIIFHFCKAANLIARMVEWIRKMVEPVIVFLGHLIIFLCVFLLFDFFLGPHFVPIQNASLSTTLFPIAFLGVIVPGLLIQIGQGIIAWVSADRLIVLNDIRDLCDETPTANMNNVQILIRMGT